MALLELEGVILVSEEDRWVWLPKEGGIFSVKSSYTILESIFLLEEGMSMLEEGVFSSL